MGLWGHATLRYTDTHDILETKVSSEDSWDILYHAHQVRHINYISIFSCLFFAHQLQQAGWEFALAKYLNFQWSMYFIWFRFERSDRVTGGGGGFALAKSHSLPVSGQTCFCSLLSSSWSTFLNLAQLFMEVDGPSLMGQNIGNQEFNVININVTMHPGTRLKTHTGSCVRNS